MDVQMGYDQLRLTPGAWLDLLRSKVGNQASKSCPSRQTNASEAATQVTGVLIGGGSPFEGRKTRFVSFRI